MTGRLLIGDEWLDAPDTFPVDNPATLEEIARVANGTREHAVLAVRRVTNVQ